MNGPDGLEAAYRRRLRAYPRRWREQNGEELLAVLLAAAENARRSRPSMAETLDLLRNGLSTRARQALEPFSPRLRGRVAGLSLAGGAGLALVCLVFGEMPVIGGPDRQMSYQVMTTFPPLLTAAPLLYLGFLGRLALAVAGRSRSGRTGGPVLLAVSTGVALTSVAARSRPIAAPPLHLVLFFVAVSLLTCLGPVRPSRGGRWLLALGTAALAGAFTATISLQYQDPGMFGVEDPRWVFYRGWQTGVQLIARQAWVLLAAGLLIAALVSLRRPGWFTATAVAGLPWLYLALLFAGGGNIAHPLLPALSFCGLTVIAVVAALAYRAGTRADRPKRTDDGPGGTSPAAAG